MTTPLIVVKCIFHLLIGIIVIFTRPMQSILNLHPTRQLSFLIWICIFYTTCSISHVQGQWWATDPIRQLNVPENYMPKLNDPCDYRVYIDFFKEVASSSDVATPYNKVVGKEYFDHPHATRQNPVKMNPKDICIRTDEDKNIDINQFDCLPNPLDINKVKGNCGCGSRWSRIDLNDRANSYIGLNASTHSYEYLAYYGLNKFLRKQRKPGTTDQYECVAHRFGHCTLDYYKDKPNWDITKCMKGFKCRNISVWSPIKKSAIVNINTGEWYGLCISEQTPDDIMDPFNSSHSTYQLNVFSLIVCVAINFLIQFTLTFQKLLSIDTQFITITEINKMI